MNPILMKVLVTAAAGGLFSLFGGEMSMESLVTLVSGLLAGFALPEVGKRDRGASDL